MKWLFIVMILLMGTTVLGHPGTEKHPPGLKTWSDFIKWEQSVGCPCLDPVKSPTEEPLPEPPPVPIERPKEIYEEPKVELVKKQNEFIKFYKEGELTRLVVCANLKSKNVVAKDMIKGGEKWNVGLPPIYQTNDMKENLRKMLGAYYFCRWH